MKSYNELERILNDEKPVLLISNGINRHNNKSHPSWEDLLGDLSPDCDLTKRMMEARDLSNTEKYDIIDHHTSNIQSPSNLKERSREDLQIRICDVLRSWQPSDHHKRIVKWAERNKMPIITVNYDENLSCAIKAEFYKHGNRHRPVFPWDSYFSTQKIEDPRTSFAIWHAHGTIRLRKSIRAGLRHYMGSVRNVRENFIYTQNTGLYTMYEAWEGKRTWLQIFFFCPIIMIGFGFNKDETFLRWLFLERAFLHRYNPQYFKKTWFVQSENNERLFLEKLGSEVIRADFEEIYENNAWNY